MAFILSKILGLLLNPILWIILLWLLSWWAKSALWKKLFGLMGIFLLFVFTNPLILHLVLRKSEYPPVPKDHLPLTDVTVVLGGANKTNMGISDQMHLNESADRVTEALMLYHQGITKSILLSGGSGELIYNDEKESTQLIDFFLASGVASAALLADTLSRNTHENVVHTKNMLKARGIDNRPIILVTSATHMYRAVKCFQKQGFEVIPYPVDYQAGKLLWSPAIVVPNVEGLIIWYKLLHEWVGIIAYKLLGYT